MTISKIFVVESSCLLNSKICIFLNSNDPISITMKEDYYPQSDYLIIMGSVTPHLCPMTRIFKHSQSPTLPSRKNHSCSNIITSNKNYSWHFLFQWSKHLPLISHQSIMVRTNILNIRTHVQKYCNSIPITWHHSHSCKLVYP